MLKVLVLGTGLAIAAVPVEAQAAEYACSLTPSEQQAFIQMGPGYAGNAQQVMHVVVDTGARQVTVWETSPDVPSGNKSTYAADINGSVVAWTIPGDEDVGPAHDSIDTAANVLTTTDPDGEPTQWNCSAN